MKLGLLYVLNRLDFELYTFLHHLNYNVIVFLYHFGMLWFTSNGFVNIRYFPTFWLNRTI